LIQIRPVRLRKWFPPKDPVATAVAMLCVLREDFLLELYGITNDRIDRLDDNDTGFRRTYFWRNSLRTLEEIKNVLNSLNSDATFRDSMSSKPPDIKAAFEELKRELNKTSDEFLRDLRNTVGGHLDQEMVQITLDGMNPEREGLIEVGDTVGKIHYRFAGELIWAALLRDAPEKTHIEKMEYLLRRSASLSQTVKAIDDVVACYVRDRKLP
jgi:hypothetical protein